MNLFTRYRLWTISRRAVPDAAFVARMNARFAPPRVVNFAYRFAAAGSALVLSLGLGTTAYAYSSDDVTPEHPLYPVRSAVENVEEAVAVTPTLKQAVQKQLVQRRLREVQVLETKKASLPRNAEEAKTLERVESVLKDGLKNNESPADIREKAAEAFKQTDLSKLRPIQRLRVQRLQNRFQSKLPKRNPAGEMDSWSQNETDER